jgi:hypothetical protein
MVHLISGLQAQLFEVALDVEESHKPLGEAPERGEELSHLPVRNVSPAARITAVSRLSPADSPTGRNLATTRTVRLGLGHTRDVSMIEGEVEVLEIDALPQERGDRFAARTGFDPRALATPYRWFRITPRRIQAWREVNELPCRELMRDGRWLV